MSLDGHLRVSCVDGIVLVVALEPVEGRAEDFGEMYGEVVDGSLRSDREHVDAWYSRHEVGRLVMHHGEARRVLNVFPKSFKCAFAHDVDFMLFVHESGEFGVIEVTGRIRKDDVVGGGGRSGCG